MAVTDYLVTLADGTLGWDGPAAVWCDGHSGGGNVGLGRATLRMPAWVRLTDWRQPSTVFSSPDILDTVRECRKAGVPAEVAEARISAAYLLWATTLDD